jgi:hypothetical protein
MHVAYTSENVKLTLTNYFPPPMLGAKWDLRVFLAAPSRYHCWFVMMFTKSDLST